ncbi:MAG TPA: hydrogenase maturation nickel metallochaperone HypA [Methanoregula sp.]|nr:hydrogenase maturation nickel metallochaperone HypA [Methanoregula sp.]
MHEYGIAYDLYATARKAALENHAREVKKISVEVGRMAMVNPEQVVFLFDTIKEDDPLFNRSVLSCEEVAPETQCICGYRGDEVFVCPRCGALPDLVRGREIVVTNIEIEVDD